MPLMNCPDCNKEMSDSAPVCPNCGKPNANAASEKRSVSILLGVGIFFIPVIFSWFTLRKGYSVLARVLSFTWLVLSIAIIGAQDGTENRVASKSGYTSTEERQMGSKSNETAYPVNNDSYAAVNSAVGCDSKYSDDKKEDIFRSNYKNHWFTWKGVVVLAESDEASLNIDGFGTQDLQVDFADPKAGYNLTKDSVITVKFLMKSAGGCFLPFSGDKAVILK